MKCRVALVSVQSAARAPDFSSGRRYAIAQCKMICEIEVSTEWLTGSRFSPMRPYVALILVLSAARALDFAV